MVHTHGVEGSTPPLAILDEFTSRGILAQLGEHLPYKQRVIGSSPIGPISTEDNDKTLLDGVENVWRIFDAGAHITAW